MEAPLRERLPVQRRKIIKKCMGAWVGLAILCGIASAFVLFGLFGFIREMAWGMLADSSLRGSLEAVLHYGWVILVAWFCFWGLVAGWMPFYEYLYLREYFYDANDQNVTIRKGVWARKEITLPFSKITDVYVDQDVFDALFGLYDVHISTPTESSGLFAHIDGVNKEDGITLKELLLERVNSAADSDSSKAQ
jgi:membrane protein YdbS with pleckstrin-like domain